jgi:glycosyltransferase involved in cell wall biosynthesis
MGLSNSNNNKPTVLAVGLFVPGTGFTRVFETLFAHLSQYFDIHWMGIGYKGTVSSTANYTLYPVNLHGGDIYGAYAAAALAAEINAGSILLLTDFYLLKNYQKPLEPLKQKGIQLIAYVPVDGYFTNTEFAGQCFFLDEMVLYNQWAMQEVGKALDAYVQNSGTTVNVQPKLSYIFHGTDTVAFTAANKSRGQLKEALFAVPDATNSIFILNANRYNERKDIESTITAFAKAVSLFNSPAYLCLHTPNLQPERTLQLLKVIEQSDCKEKILLNPLGDTYCSNEQLTALYTACDIGVNTSYGEGWGMISFEHAACGAAQLVPAHTAPGELWKGTGVLIPVEKSVQLNTNPFLMYRINTDVLANEMAQLVNDEGYRNTVSAQCLQHVNSNVFNWNHIAEQWMEKLRAVKKAISF